MSIMKDELGIDEFPIKGYDILLKAIIIPEITKGGIHLPDSMRNTEKRHYNIGHVMAIGDEAFEDKARFPKGPRCKVGDWVYYRKYERQEEFINDNLCFFLTDDRIITPFPPKLLPAIVPELRNRGATNG